MKPILSFIFLFIFFSSSFAGGGWPQPKGGGFFKLYEWWIVSDEHFTSNGGIDGNITNGFFNTSIYGEYGFTDRLTGVINFPLFSRSYHNNTISRATGETIIEGEALNSIGDANIGLKYGLLQGPIAVSATLTFGLPLGDDGSDPKEGSLGILQTGDGEFNQLLQIDAGTGFKIGETDGYANAYLGYNNRTNDFSDEVHFGIEAGIKLFNNRVLAIARLQGIESTQNGESGKGENSTSIFANNSEFFSFNPEIAYNINDNWGISVGIGTAFSGKLIYADPSYTVGVFYHWN